MAAKNNFKKLQEEQNNQFPSSPPPDVEKNVKGSVRLFQFMGDIVELYLPKVFEIFISLVGGEKNEEQDALEGGEADDDDSNPQGEQKPD